MISCNIALLPILRLIESSAFQFNLYLFCRIWGQHKYALLRCGGAYWWRQHREFAASLMPHCISCISCDLQSGERCLHKAVLLLFNSTYTFFAESEANINMRYCVAEVRTDEGSIVSLLHLWCHIAFPVFLATCNQANVVCIKPYCCYESSNLTRRLWIPAEPASWVCNISRD